jgi:hypothetical protein
MENIYKQFMNNFNNEKEVSLEVIRNYTKDIIDLLDLNKYILNVVETTDKNIIAQYDHDRKIIEYNIKKINDYAMKNNKNKSKRELIFDNIIMNLQTIRHEIRHAEQNKNYYELISNIERLIYIDSLCSAEIYDMMYYYCPIEIDANFEGIVEIDNFFKKTNYLNQEMSKEKALSFVKFALTIVHSRWLYGVLTTCK